MSKLRRLLPLAALLAAGALHAAPAAASSTQQALFQDDSRLKSDPVRTLATLHSLGVSVVRVGLTWDSVAPSAGSSHKPRFNASDPGAPQYNWSIYDTIDYYANIDGISVDFILTGPAPQWATSSGEPRGGFAGVWRPSAAEFRQFAEAAGRRYGGGFTPAGRPTLPRVSTWSLWNEPNYGFDLAPQGLGGVPVAAGYYRALVDAGWSGLAAAGHRPGRDTILFGETAPRAPSDTPGLFNGTKPLQFLRALYCVDSHYRFVRGSYARALGCPTTTAASRAFRRAHPALFSASGFAAHLYASQSNPGPPTQPTNYPGRRGGDPDFADLPAVGNLEGTLDRLNRVYGSLTRFPIWNTEYAYRTHPPDPHESLSQATAAYWMNWGEYISYRNSRIASYMQYLLVDPAGGVFASGLLMPDGRTAKATYYAYRMPLFLPGGVQRGRKGTVEVWGAVRPAHTYSGTQRAFIEWRRNSHSGWSHIAAVVLRNPRGYFDVRVHFPASGQVRVAWAPPHRGGEYSRTAGVTVR